MGILKKYLDTFIELLTTVIAYTGAIVYMAVPFVVLADMYQRDYLAMAMTIIFSLFLRDYIKKIL